MDEEEVKVLERGMGDEYSGCRQREELECGI